MHNLKYIMLINNIGKYGKNLQKKKNNHNKYVKYNKIFK